LDSLSVDILSDFFSFCGEFCDDFDDFCEGFCADFCDFVLAAAIFASAREARLEPLAAPTALMASTCSGEREAALAYDNKPSVFLVIVFATLA